MSPRHRVNHDEEIDLLDLIQSLWSQKLLISLAMVICTSVAGAYAFFSTPVYQAKASLLPPTRGDISAYNLGRGGAIQEGSAILQVSALPAEFSVEDVYAVFTRNLRSESLRRSFFNDVYLPAVKGEKNKQARDKYWNEFATVLKVTNPEPKVRPEYYEVIVEQVNPVLATEWVNQFVMLAAQKAEESLLRSISAEANTRVGSLRTAVEALRSSAERERMNRMVQLREALQVAEAIGLEGTQEIGGRVVIEAGLASVNDSLAYMRGAKAIRAELQALEARKSDDPFIAGLSELETQIEFYNQVAVRSEAASVFTLDTPAEVPDAPIKPNKPLVVAAGFIVGGVLGVFAAFVRVVLRRRETL